MEKPVFVRKGWLGAVSYWKLYLSHDDIGKIGNAAELVAALSKFAAGIIARVPRLKKAIDAVGGVFVRKLKHADKKYGNWGVNLVFHAGWAWPIFDGRFFVLVVRGPEYR
jgi:hypothetical protein